LAEQRQDLPAASAAWKQAALVAQLDLR
jgi:hypothetical protein